MTVIAPRAGDEAELRGLSVMEEAKASARSCQGVARHYSCELVPIDELEQLALGYRRESLRPPDSEVPVAGTDDFSDEFEFFRREEPELGRTTSRPR